MATQVHIEEQRILESLINIRTRLTALKKNRSVYIKASDVMAIYEKVVEQITKLNDIRDEPFPRVRNDDDDNRVDTTLNDVFQLLSLFFLSIGKSRESPATYVQLATIRQLMGHMLESGVYTATDLEPFSRRLAEMREIITRDAANGRHPEELTKLLMRRLENRENTLKKLQDSLSVLDVELVPIHQRLVTMRRQLAAIAAKPKPTAAELKPIQDELRKIDSKRQDGKFLGPGGSSVPPGQAILVGLLEENFDLCHDIQARGEDVSIPLKPIYDRLWELRAQLERLCLTQRWTLHHTDLYNYQMDLQKIDSLRKNGKFVDDEGNAPDGQMVLLYLLRRCYGLLYRLMSSSEPVSEALMPLNNALNTVKKCLTELKKYGSGIYTQRDLYPYAMKLMSINGQRKDGKWIAGDGSVPEGQGVLNALLNECNDLIDELREDSEQKSKEDEV